MHFAEQGQKENERGGTGHRLLDHVRSPSASRHHSTWLASSKRYDKRYEARFLDQEKSIYRKSTYQEGARCMLVFTNPTADFSAGCALPIIARSFLVTHPITLPFANGTVPAPVSGGSHHSASLFTAPIS
jgi:hypothetical protein